MQFLKKNVVAVIALLVCMFFAIRGYQNPSSEIAEASYIYISLAIILLVMLILIYFKYYRRSQ